MITKYVSKNFNCKIFRIEKGELKETQKFLSLHFSSEFILVTKGKALIRCEEYVFTPEVQDVCYFPKKNLHYVSVEADDEFECFIFRFNNDLFKHTLPQFDINKPFWIKGNERFELDVNDVKFNYKILDPMDFEVYLTNKFFDSINIINDHLVDIHEVEADPVLRSIIKYLNSNLYKKVTLDDISVATNYSASYLSAYFKKNMGISLLKYFEGKKMFLAKELLDEGMKPIDICNKVEIDTYTTFYRQFKHTLGTNPSCDFDVNLDEVYEKIDE